MGHAAYDISVFVSGFPSENSKCETTELFEADLAACRRLGNNSGGASALYHLGTIALEQGDHARAQVYYTESLMLRWELGDRRGIADCLEGLAGVASIRGLAESAAQLCGAAELFEGGAEPLRVGRVHPLHQKAEAHEVAHETRADEGGADLVAHHPGAAHQVLLLSDARPT